MWAQRPLIRFQDSVDRFLESYLASQVDWILTDAEIYYTILLLRETLFEDSSTPRGEAEVLSAIVYYNDAPGLSNIVLLCCSKSSTSLEGAVASALWKWDVLWTSDAHHTL